MQPCPWLPSGNLGTGLGSQTEDALRARAQSWRSFLGAMKGQTVLRLNMSGWRGVHAQRPHWSTVQASLCKVSLVLKNGVNEDPVWVNRQTLTSYRGEENGAVSLPGGFSDIVSDSMNQLLHIISWGSRYFNCLIIPTDLMAPASDVMRETSEQAMLKGNGFTHGK